VKLRRAGPALELGPDGKPVDLAEVRRRGLVVIGRRIQAEQAQAIAAGRLPRPLDPIDEEALALAMRARDS